MQMEEGLAQECSGLVLPWADVAGLTEAQKWALVSVSDLPAPLLTSWAL